MWGLPGFRVDVKRISTPRFASQGQLAIAAQGPVDHQDLPVLPERLEPPQFPGPRKNGFPPRDSKASEEKTTGGLSAREEPGEYLVAHTGFEPVLPA